MEWYISVDSRRTQAKMADSQDINSNEKTYGGFISLLKWAIPLIAVMVALIVYAIS